MSAVRKNALSYFLESVFAEEIPTAQREPIELCSSRCAVGPLPLVLRMKSAKKFPPCRGRPRMSFTGMADGQRRAERKALLTIFLN